MEVLNSYIADKSRHNVFLRNYFWRKPCIVFIFNDAFDSSSYTASRDEIGEKEEFKRLLKEAAVA